MPEQDPWNIVLGPENNNFRNRWRVRILGLSPEDIARLEAAARRQRGYDAPSDARVRAMYDDALKSDPDFLNTINGGAGAVAEWRKKVEAHPRYSTLLKLIEEENRRLSEPPGAELKRRVDGFFQLGPPPKPRPRAPDPSGTIERKAKESFLV